MCNHFFGPMQIWSQIYDPSKKKKKKKLTQKNEIYINQMKNYSNEIMQNSHIKKTDIIMHEDR